jgi:beta-glucanase (GH16 family)/Ca2+-binding RTX toxin-like protein
VTIDPKNLSATATLTFSDEFNALSLWNGTSGTWTTKYPFAPEKGSTLPSNGELEWYINAMYAPTTSVRPWTVSNGILTLTAQPAPASLQPLIDGYQYTSGLINTYNSFTQTYGYFEMRAQLPAGQGLWPAFWLLQADLSWPPEIDAMEVLGHDMTTLYTAVHTNQTGSHTSSGGTIKVPDMSAGFHTYGVDWQADYITYYFDGNQVYKAPTPADMHEPMYMIANLAVGGNWPGNPNSTTPFPAQMKIDYIRAYKDGPSTNPPPTNPPPTNPPPTNPPPTSPNPPLLSKLFALPTSANWVSTIRGSSRDDTLNGTAAANRIDGRGGSDTMTGNGGDDTYLVDRSTDVIVESSGGGVDTVQSRASSYTLPGNVENLRLTGSSAQTANGNALGNILTSNNYSSTLNGGDGNDIIIAGSRANVLTGGAGSDIFQFKSVPITAGRITDYKAGTDMLDLRGLFGNYNGSNPVADGYLSFESDGAGGTRVYFDSDGAGSSLKKLVTTLSGVSPSSLTMQADWYFSSTAGAGPTTPPPATPPPTNPPPAASSGLFTLPTSGTGIDTVTTAAASYTLGAGEENLHLGGSGPQSGVGNGLNNILWSNNYGSTLNGGAGNDIIIAGRSWDVLTGGAGSDIFQFDNLPWNNSRITDFTVGTDMLDLRKLFTAANYQGTNPVADGYVSFQSDGVGGTKVYFDPDGPAPGNPWPFLITTIDNVAPSGLHMHTEWYFH